VDRVGNCGFRVIRNQYRYVAPLPAVLGLYLHIEVADRLTLYDLLANEAVGRTDHTAFVAALQNTPAWLAYRLDGRQAKHGFSLLIKGYYPAISVNCKGRVGGAGNKVSDLAEPHLKPS
jgi:hypothetical protein